MTCYSRRKYGVKVALVFFLAAQIFLFPFFHYHPDNVHGHQGELAPHQHKGHFHSPEFDKLSRSITHYSSGPGQEEGQHHSHPFADRGPDSYEINFHKSSVNPGQTFKKIKDGSNQTPLIVSTPTLIHPVLFKAPFPTATVPKGVFKERSPPLLI